MDFKKCSRCGNFYVSNGNVCPKCTPKDNFEFSTFKSYVSENGLNNSIDTISDATGISVKNLNRFIEYNNGIQSNNTPNVQTKLNQDNNGITFLI
jgi:hypothetical protein